MAQVDRVRILERGVFGSSSLCGGSVAVFTFFFFKWGLGKIRSLSTEWRKESLIQIKFSLKERLTQIKLFLRQDPLDLSFWSFLTFLHHGIEEVERHLLVKFYKKIRRKSWSNVPPKLLACLGFQYKVVHKIGRLRKFNRSREIKFNFFTAWSISIKFGTLLQHALWLQNVASDFSILPRDLVMVFQSRKNGVTSSLNFERS